jgi:hypothetical protein
MVQQLSPRPPQEVSVSRVRLRQMVRLDSM